MGKPGSFRPTARNQGREMDTISEFSRSSCKESMSAAARLAVQLSSMQLASHWVAAQASWLEGGLSLSRQARH